LSRRDVTRGEYNRIIDILNERNAILNGLRDGLSSLQQASDVQFKRIAQIQAELDAIRRAWEKMKLAIESHLNVRRESITRTRRAQQSRTERRNRGHHTPRPAVPVALIAQAEVAVF
jgi:hypothetical protein